MAMKRKKLYPVLTAITVLLGSGELALAQADEGRMNEWFDALSTAEPAEAIQLTREIERAWSLSGSTALDSLLRRGRAALEEEDTDAAIEHLTALTDHAPDFAEGWHARATAFYMKDLYGPALDDLQKTLALNPRHYNALFGLGVMFQEFGDYPRAERAFLMVLDLHPHHERATQALDALKREGFGHRL